ncbi:unnamed protein product, partial [Ectocarpus sp. 4 AP-2014]
MSALQHSPRHPPTPPVPLFLQPSYKSTHIHVGTEVHNCIPRLARSYPGEHARRMLAIIGP